MARPKRQTVAQRKAYVAKWRRANRDKMRAYSAKWNAAHRSQRRAIERSWRERHPENVARYNAKAGAKWTQNNRGRRNAITAARRASLRQRMPAWADRSAILVFYETAARLTRETGIPHEVDHIIPLRGSAVSGLHVAENLQIITRRANRSKGTKPCVA